MSHETQAMLLQILPYLIMALIFIQGKRRSKRLAARMDRLAVRNKKILGLCKMAYNEAKKSIALFELLEETLSNHTVSEPDMANDDEEGEHPVENRPDVRESDSGRMSAVPRRRSPRVSGNA